MILHQTITNAAFLQSRRLEARLRSSGSVAGQEAKKEYVHMLNCTLSATERTLCCVLENNQTREGVKYASLVFVAPPPLF